MSHRATTLVDQVDRLATVSFTTDGDLEFAVCDSGPAVEEFFGTDQYEFWHTVPKDRVPEFCGLAELDVTDPIGSLRDQWSGDDRFRALCKLMAGTDYVRLTTWSSFT